MKIILLKDVKGIGRAHEVIDAKDGHALNYLLPKKLAISATPTAIKEAELRRKQMTERTALDGALLAQNIATLTDARVVIRMKANEKGHLYDAVGESEIRTSAKEQAHIDLPEGAVRLEKSIKELGTFDVPIAVGDIFGKFSVTIEAE